MAEIPFDIVEMTPEEEAERNAMAAELEAQDQAYRDALAAKETALAKLKKLGLTADEAKAVIGMS